LVLPDDESVVDILDSITRNSEVAYRMTNIFLEYVKIKCQLDAKEVFIADLIACSAPNQTSNLKTTARKTTGSNHCILLLSS